MSFGVVPESADRNGEKNESKISDTLLQRLLRNGNLTAQRKSQQLAAEMDSLIMAEPLLSYPLWNSREIRIMYTE